MCKLLITLQRACVRDSLNTISALAAASAAAALHSAVRIISDQSVVVCCKLSVVEWKSECDMSLRWFVDIVIMNFTCTYVILLLAHCDSHSVIRPANCQ